MTNNQNYQQQKAEFLDSLSPDDFRNGGSFNQAELIIDELFSSASETTDPVKFVTKAVSHLFRENSPVVGKAISLIEKYLSDLSAQDELKN